MPWRRTAAADKKQVVSGRTKRASISELHKKYEKNTDTPDPFARASFAVRRSGGGTDHHARKIFRHDGVADELQLPAMVPRRQVRHLGALGAAGRADGGRLVCAQNVSGRFGGLQRSSRALRPSLDEWLEGHHSTLESRAVGSGEIDGALQKSRREILRQHGHASRRFFPVEFAVAPMECRELRSASRRGGRLAKGREEKWPA